MPYRLHIEKQSVYLSIDPDNFKIKGQTKLVVNIIEGSENNENSIPSRNPQADQKQRANENENNMREGDEDRQQQQQMGQEDEEQQQGDMANKKKEENLIMDSMVLHLHAQQLRITDIRYDKQEGDDLISLQQFYYMSVEKQQTIIAGMMPNAGSIDSFIMNHRKCFENKEISGLQLIFSVNIENMQHTIERQEEDNIQNATDALPYSGVLTINYDIEMPIAGIRFLENSRISSSQKGEFADIETKEIKEIFCITEFFPRCAQFWLPCIDREVFFSELCVQVPSRPIKFDGQVYDYQALCSGDLSDHLIDEQNNMLFKYQIQKKLKAEHLGICVGRFKQQQNSNKQNQFTVSCSLGVDINRLDLAVYTSEQVLKGIQQQQLQDLSDHLNVYKLIILPNLNIISSNSINVFQQDDYRLTPFNSYKLISNQNYNYHEHVIKSFDYTIDSLSNSFYKLSFLDEYFLPPIIQQTSSENTNRALQFFKTINLSICQQKVNISSRYHADFWILIGIQGFMTDLYHKQLLSDKENALEFRMLMAKQFERLNFLVEQGEELSPLSTNDELTMGFEKFVDEVFILKSRLIFHVLAIRCNSKGSEFVNSIIDSVEKEYKITTDLLFKVINRKHSIKDPHFKKQFIESTGVPHFAFKYEDSRKENKISVEVMQSALQEEYFRYHNYYRNELEKKNDIHSSALKLLENETPCNDDQEEEQKGGQQNDDIGHSQKLKNTQSGKHITRENLGNGRLIVPLILKSSRFFQGKLELIVSEVRDKDQQNTQNSKDDELRVITLDKNYKFTRDVAYRSETRKNNGKKKDDDDDNNNNNNNSSEGKKRNLGQKKLQDELEKVWIKIDPLKKYLLSLDFPKQNLHSLLTQLMKDKKNRYKYISVTLYLLRQLRNKDYSNDSYDIVKNLKIIVQKDELETELQVEVLDVIIRNSVYNKKARQECIQLLEELIKKNVIHNDKSLLPNNFDNHKRFNILTCIVRGLSACVDESLLIDKNIQMSSNQASSGQKYDQLIKYKNMMKQLEQCHPPENAVRYLLKLLRENDNSINRYDDSLFRSNLIGSLLLTNHPSFPIQILHEVITSLQYEYLEPSFNSIVLKAIVINYHHFLYRNKLYKEIQCIEQEDMNSSDQTNELNNNYSFSNSSSTKCDYTSNQLIKQVEKQLLDFKKIHNQNIMRSVYFYDKFRSMIDQNSANFKNNINNQGAEVNGHQNQNGNNQKGPYECHQLLIFLIKEIERSKTQLQYNYDYINYLAIIRQYVHTNINQFVTQMQFQLDIFQNTMFAQILWEQLVSPTSLYNPLVRLYWIKIYKDIYFHWAPFSSVVRRLATSEEEDLGFCIDKTWVNWSKSENDKKDQSDEQKFGWILKPKKRKRINSDFNVYDQIMSFCKKNKDKVNVTGISKNILDLLIKHFDNDKKGVPEFSAGGNSHMLDGNSNNITILMRNNSFKQVKKCLKKDKYKTFDDVRRVTLQVSDEYLAGQKITAVKKQKQDILKNLINHCFNTAQAVLSQINKRASISQVEGNNIIIQSQSQQQLSIIKQQQSIQQIQKPLNSNGISNNFGANSQQNNINRRVSIQEEKNNIIRLAPRLS